MYCIVLVQESSWTCGKTKSRGCKCSFAYVIALSFAVSKQRKLHGRCHFSDTNWAHCGAKWRRFIGGIPLPTRCFLHNWTDYLRRRRVYSEWLLYPPKPGTKALTTPLFVIGRGSTFSHYLLHDSLECFCIKLKNIKWKFLYY